MQTEEPQTEDEPKHVFIELCSVCNFNCDFCTYSLSKRPKEFISMRLLEKILKDLERIAPVEYVHFSPFGEPTMHPRFGDACRLVKRHGYKLHVVTNGSLLDESMLSLPIDELFISLQTPTEESFRHRGASIGLEEYLGRICSFAAQARFKIHVRLFTENNFERPDISGLTDLSTIKGVRIVEDIGRRINPGFTFLHNRDPWLNLVPVLPNVDIQMTPLILCLHRAELLPKHLTLNPAESVSCPLYKQHVSVLSDGRVSFCCNDDQGELCAGNVRYERLDRICQRRLEGNLTYPMCLLCAGTLQLKE